MGGLVHKAGRVVGLTFSGTLGIYMRFVWLIYMHFRLIMVHKYLQSRGYCTTMWSVQLCTYHHHFRRATWVKLGRWASKHIFWVGAFMHSEPCVFQVPPLQKVGFKGKFPQFPRAACKRSPTLVPWVPCTNTRKLKTIIFILKMSPSRRVFQGVKRSPHLRGG